MGAPLFLKVASIESIEGYKVRLKFNNGETKTIDFQRFFRPARRFEKILLEDHDKFSSMEVSNGTLTWFCLGITIGDAKGHKGFYAFNIDPRRLYEYEPPEEDEGGNEGTKE